VNESLVKYLAGLLDADGSLSFQFVNKDMSGSYRVNLLIYLCASEGIDRNGFVKGLPSLTGMGHASLIPPKDVVICGKPSRQRHTVHVWQVSKRADLEMLLPRLIKHQVIKAKHWQWLLDVWREKRGVRVSAEEKEALVVASKESRRTRVGPIKPKNHPTWAWLAGYLDGDGSYIFKPNITKRWGTAWSIAVSAVAHVNDRHVLDFLQQAFGGGISQDHRAPALLWKRNLGYQNRSFAERFLPNLAKHSRFKRDKIDAILYHHRQRLSPPGSKRKGTQYVLPLHLG
jgi:hypothetical protein